MRGHASAAVPVSPPPSSGAADARSVRAPLAGSLVRWHREAGQSVNQGDVVATLESMKMETAVTAPESGTLVDLITPGASVVAGQQIAYVKA